MAELQWRTTRDHRETASDRLHGDGGLKATGERGTVYLMEPTPELSWPWRLTVFYGDDRETVCRFRGYAPDLYRAAQDVEDHPCEAHAPAPPNTYAVECYLRELAR